MGGRAGGVGGSVASLPDAFLGPFRFDAVPRDALVVPLGAIAPVIVVAGSEGVRTVNEMLGAAIGAAAPTERNRRTA